MVLVCALFGLAPRRPAGSIGLAVWQNRKCGARADPFPSPDFRAAYLLLFRCVGDVERRCRRDVRHQFLE
jgi:hypothetical protein